MWIKGACYCASNIIPLCSSCVAHILLVRYYARAIILSKIRAIVYRAIIAVARDTVHTCTCTLTSEKFPPFNLCNLRSLFTLRVLRCTLCLRFWCKHRAELFCSSYFNGLILYHISKWKYLKIIYHLWEFFAELFLRLFN